jgi:pimeloyl-ACP methyl ester carboxylesterase
MKFNVSFILMSRHPCTQTEKKSPQSKPIGVVCNMPIYLAFACLCASSWAQVINGTQVNLDQFSAQTFFAIICNQVLVTPPQNSYATPICRTDLAVPTPAPPSLTIGHVTLSGGRLASFIDSTGDTYNLYWSFNEVFDESPDDALTGVLSLPGDSQTITLTFDTGVSGVYFLLQTTLPGGVEPQGTDNPSLDYIVTDDQGESLTVQPMYTLSGVQLFAQNIHQVTITAPLFQPVGAPVPSWDFGIKSISYGATGITAVDPVPNLLGGSGIIADPNSLATLGTPVSAISADSAARVVLRINANAVGENLLITGVDDMGQWNASDGSFASISGSPSGSSLQVTAVNTSQGPMAFGIYLAPPDFARSGGIDDNSASRAIRLQVQSLSVPGYAPTIPLKILRPPIVLLPGLWAEATAWSNFTQLTNDPNQRFFVRPFSYGPKVGISNAVPDDYPFVSPLSSVSPNALGLGYNAPGVLRQIEQVVSDFRRVENAAAAQADVVAHSMGGDVTRALVQLPRNVSPSSFGAGSVHKLITIGTPHLGSPVALALLTPPTGPGNNNCVRQTLEAFGNVALSSATVAGTSFTGAIADLGAPVGATADNGQLSQAIQNIQSGSGLQAPTALIGGTMAAQNLASLGPPNFNVLRAICGAAAGDPLANSLTSTGWPLVFGAGGQPSDGMVSLVSQLPPNGVGSPLSDGLTNPFSGVVHSAGVVNLGFTGPDELNYSPIQTAVIQLLNASIQSSGFQSLP